MATRTPGGVDSGVDLPGRRFERTGTDHRRSTNETKDAFKTTEFIAYAAVLFGILIAGLVVEDNGGQDFFTADKVWLYATILTVGYMISRGLAKAGTREPYYGDGDERR